MQHTVIALLQDRPGALNRAVSLFRRRGFNIDSLAVASTELRGLSRMTIVVDQDEVRQVVRQLERLVDIISVRDVTFDRSVAQEMCLVRLGAPGTRLGELLAVAREFDARVVDAGPDAVVLAVMDTPPMVSACLDRLRPFGVAELTRSGRIAMAVGAPAGGGSPPPGTSPRPPHADESGTGRPYTWQADGVAGDEAA
ncbi:MAG: acetolactate synthase small subunit [Gemmatimonadaceae bacterium]